MFRVAEEVVLGLVVAIVVALSFAVIGAGILVPVVFLATLIWLWKIIGAARGH